MATNFISLEALKARTGQPLGHSNWFLIDQDRINEFADLTDDHQFIHVDPVRAAAETPFGGTVAHGFLSLSLLGSMGTEILPTIEGFKAGLNYGFDKVRFLTPVPSGRRVRGGITLRDVEVRRPKEILTRLEVAIEIEHQPKPALIAEWLILNLLV